MMQKPGGLSMLMAEKSGPVRRSNRAAAYHAFVKSAAQSTATFVMDISGLQGSTYSFTASSFSPEGVLLETYKGEMPNFVIDTSTQKFSSDVVFTGLPWKGKMT